MSDTMQAPPLGGTDPGSDGPANNRRLLTVLAAVVGLVVLGAAVYFLFLSGGGSDDELGPLPQGAPTQAVPSDDDKAPKVDANPLPKKFQGIVGRNPFQPLGAETVIEEVAVTDESTVPSEPEPVTSETAAPEPTTEPTPTPAPTITVPEPDPTPSETETTEQTRYNVTVKSVNLGEDKALLEVNGKQYRVGTKENFPDSEKGPFELLRVGRSDSGKAIATVIFGSEQPVKLMEGKQETFRL